MPAPTDFDVTQNPSTLTGYVLNLHQYSLLEVGGRDASVFLHSQLTHDFQSLPTDRARLAGLCSTKGRLLAHLLGWSIPSPAHDTASALASSPTQEDQRNILFLLPSDLISDVIQTLSKFILRRKVTLTEATSKFALIGLIGENSAWASLFPTLPTTRYEVVHSDAGMLIYLGNTPIQNQAECADAAALILPARYLWIVPQQTFQSKIEALAQHAPPLSSDIWDWLTIQAGEPHITATTQGLLVPQRANLDLLDGISFKKGCYPGQEVVARLQYRGVTRHRTVLLRTTKAQVGEEIFHQDHAASSGDASTENLSPITNEATSCGIVLNAAPHPTLIDTVDCLAMLPLATLKSGTLHMGHINGPLLARLPLPYALPEESEGTI